MGLNRNTPTPPMTLMRSFGGCIMPWALVTLWLRTQFGGGWPPPPRSPAPPSSDSDEDLSLLPSRDLTTALYRLGPLESSFEDDFKAGSVSETSPEQDDVENPQNAQDPQVLHQECVRLHYHRRRPHYICHKYCRYHCDLHKPHRLSAIFAIPTMSGPVPRLSPLHGGGRRCQGDTRMTPTRLRVHDLGGGHSNPGLGGGGGGKGWNSCQQEGEEQSEDPNDRRDSDEEFWAPGGAAKCRKYRLYAGSQFGGGRVVRYRFLAVSLIKRWATAIQLHWIQARKRIQIPYPSFSSKWLWGIFVYHLRF